MLLKINIPNRIENYDDRLSFFIYLILETKLVIQSTPPIIISVINQ